MIEAKETVVGSLGSTKQSLKGSTNASSTFTAEYKLPIASEDTLGGVMVGDNLNIDEYGVLSATGVTSYNDLTDKPTIPANTSDLNNDSGFLTEIPEEYITEEELANKGYVNKDEIPTVPTKTSQLTNDSGFLTEHQDISHLATKDELHTHSNKTVLDSISQENLDKWNAGSRNVVLSATEPTFGEEIWFQKSVNLFNKETAEQIGYIQQDGSIYRRSNYYITDYIKVIPEEQYTYSGFLVSITNVGVINHAYYDENKNLVSTFARTKDFSGTITIPEGVSYIKFSLYFYSDDVDNELHTFQFEKGSTASEYQPYTDGEKIYTKTNAGYEEFITNNSTGGVIEETDPTVPAHVKAITQSDIAKWNSGTGSVEDSGWLDAEIVSTSGTWSRFKYRKIGNRVRIEGRVSNLAYNGSEYTVGKIPVEYAPTSTINTYGFTSKNIIARFVVNASGEIKFSWNLNMSTDSDNKNASWYNFDFEYLTD